MTIRSRNSQIILATGLLGLWIHGCLTAGAEESLSPSASMWTWVEPEQADAIRARWAQGLGADAGRPLSPANKVVKLDRVKLGRILDAADARLGLGADAERAAAAEIQVPLSDKRLGRFRIEPYSVMPPELAARYPQIRNYRGRGVDDPNQKLTIDDSPTGFHAQVLSPTGPTVYVDPIDPRENSYMVYSKQDQEPRRGQFKCLVPADDGQPRPAARGGAPIPRSGEVRRTYRLAVACTREYAMRFLEPDKTEPTKLGALSGINTTFRRVNSIYEQELGVHLEFVPNTDALLFPDPNLFPLNNGNANVLIGQSQTLIDTIVGNAKYDIGHTVSTGGGGLASLGCVCKTGRKARGITGSDDPRGDAFDVDYVAHEVGHQFGGNHTFNSNQDNCGGGNRNSGTAVEPGSGSTIQGYAGICGTDDLQRNSNPYFHAVSLDEMLNYIITEAPTQSQPLRTGNTIPSVTAPAAFHIPNSTPFVLTASGHDPDGDALTYCWEQIDPGDHDSRLSDRDDGHIPLFRSFPPISEPSRYFPRITVLAASSRANDEKLPEKGRSMRFRVTVRDGRSGVNGTETKLTVHEDAGPFQLTAPKAGTVLPRKAKVQWDVAGTNTGEIAVKHVNILMSTDGGFTYSTTLASGVKNDGEEEVEFPVAAVSLARIKVEAVGNVFFNISPGNFTIDPSLPTDGVGKTDAGDIAILEPAGNALAPTRPMDGEANRSAPGIRSLSTDYVGVENEPLPSVLVIANREKLAEVLSVLSSTKAATPTASQHRRPDGGEPTTEEARLRLRLRELKQEMTRIKSQLKRVVPVGGQTADH